MDGERREDSESEEGEMEKGMTNHASKKRGKSENKTVISLRCLCYIPVAALTLKQMDSKIFIQKKMGLAGKNKEL